MKARGRLAEGPTPRALFSLGMGVDSSALATAWLLGILPPPCDLQDLVVLIAQTGDEWPRTRQLMEEQLFPMLAARGVRTVQVARAGPREADGVVVLDDTRTPSTCHTEGAYTLGDEMLSGGTIPQSGGARRCSLRAKGFPLDWAAARLTQGRPYLHVVGYELEERGRVIRDRPLGPQNRIPLYPLVDAGWTRRTCEDVLLTHHGTPWEKSRCTYCPFSLSSKVGRARTLAQYVQSPDQAMLPLLMEHVAVSLNPRQGLIAGERLADQLAAFPGGPTVLARFAADLDSRPWAVYRVRRVWQATAAGRDQAGPVARDLQVIAEGSRAQARAELACVPGERTVEGGIERVWIRRRIVGVYPAREELLVAAPATAETKRGPAFTGAWAHAEWLENQMELF
ncbi:hypothetical protein ACFVWN_00915 [Nocardiopsis flavescens]|uniref:hypothetical protein n=1 Tax=Nocardiopsis flavescens TaxID=758803 RepID=UPI0036473F34